MLRLSALLLLLPTIATAQVYVPSECSDLAIREGFPSDVMTKTEAAKAKIRLARLSDKEPDVKACREAIKAMKK